MFGLISFVFEMMPLIILGTVVYTIVKKIRKSEREKVEREQQQRMMQNYYQSTAFNPYEQAQRNQQNQRRNASQAAQSSFFRDDTPDEVYEEEAKDPELKKVNDALLRIDDEIDHAAYEIQRVKHDTNLTVQAKGAMCDVLQNRISRFRDQYSQLYMLKLQYKDASKGNRAEAQRLINNMKDLIQAYDTLDGNAADPFAKYDQVKGYDSYGNAQAGGQRAQGRM